MVAIRIKPLPGLAAASQRFPSCVTKQCNKPGLSFPLEEQTKLCFNGLDLLLPFGDELEVGSKLEV